MDLTHGDTATGHPVRVSCGSTSTLLACRWTAAGLPRGPHRGLRGYRTGVRAVVITKPGEPDVLAVEDVPDPVPAPGELLVEVSRRHGEAVVWVYLGDGWTGFSLSLESAGRLSSALVTALSTTRGTGRA